MISISNLTNTKDMFMCDNSPQHSTAISFMHKIETTASLCKAEDFIVIPPQKMLQFSMRLNFPYFKPFSLYWKLLSTIIGYCLRNPLHTQHSSFTPIERLYNPRIRIFLFRHESLMHQKCRIHKFTLEHISGIPNSKFLSTESKKSQFLLTKQRKFCVRG